MYTFLLGRLVLLGVDLSTHVICCIHISQTWHSFLYPFRIAFPCYVESR